jgi:GT2 family glycosyltransferase
MYLVDASGVPYRGFDLSIASLRRVSLLELGLRVGVNTPRKLFFILRLLISGNHKGEAFRFARAVDELNALPYRHWLAMHQRAVAAAFTPENIDGISILVTIEAGSKAHIDTTLASLQKQSWKAWKRVEPAALAQFRRMQQGQELLWMNLPAGSVLAENALEQLVQPFSAPDVRVVYSDEDLISPLGRRHSPVFKPSWSPLLAQSEWLSLDGALVKLSAVPESFNFCVESVNEAIISIAKSMSTSIVHLPRVLISRRRSQRKKPIPPRKPNSLHSFRPKVSVIIPTRDRRDLLAACVDGLLKRTADVDLDLVIIDNDSADPETLGYLKALERNGIAQLVPMPGPFNFSRACNLGIDAALHELILLLNNDVDPLAEDWLTQMVHEMADPAVGAVGAYLFYPDGLVQHAGVTLGAGSVARHSFSFFHPDSGEDKGLLAERRDVSAVTGACLLTNRSLWRAVGGMDEENLAVAFNDVDYCLKLRQFGKRIIWTPHARLWHHESVSRGKDSTEEKLRRFAHEEATMHRRWGDRLQNDPFHNPNLSTVAEDFVLESFPRKLTGRTQAWE